MAVLPLAAARRRRVPDPRVLIGVALVLVSALGVTGLVAGLDRSVVVYRAGHALVAGDPVGAGDLQPVPVRLGDAQRLYLTGRMPKEGLVLTRAVDAGELVPVSALGSAAAADTATVVVDLGSRLSGTIATGSVVDLWSAPRAAGAGEHYGAPAVIVSGATVRRVDSANALVPGGQQNTAELQVPKDDVASVLQAIADGSRLTVVAVGQAVGR